LADLGFCVPLQSLCCLILVFVFLCGVCVSWSWFLCSFVEFVLADLGFWVPLWSLCWLILVFVFLCRVCVGWSWFLCSFVEFVLADLGFCVPFRSLCWLILVFVFLCGVCVGWSSQKQRSANTNSTKEHKNQDQPTQTPQRNTKKKISQHKLHKGTQKPR
jgi:predicted membrane protein